MQLYSSDVFTLCDFVTLTFDLSTSKYSFAGYPYIITYNLPFFGFLSSYMGLSVLELSRSTRQTDGQTDGQTPTIIL